MSGNRVGSLISAVAGLVFILINAGSLSGDVTMVVRVLGVVAFIVVVTLTLRRADPPPSSPAPDQRAWRTYWSMVTIEGVLIPVGAMGFSQLDLPELVVPWVALIVGVHFLPFAKAFNVPDFRLLAWTIIGLAVAGGVLAITVSAEAGAVVAGVISGVALLGAALRGLTPAPAPATATV